MSDILIIDSETRVKSLGRAPIETGRAGSGTEVRYFMGGDPAPAQGKKSDDGALAVLKAWPKTAEPSNYLADWQAAFVWGQRVRGARAPQWSGIIHTKHQHFNLSEILLDDGGGGQWVYPELALSRQLINGVETECTPLVVPGDDRAPMGDFIVRRFKRGGIDELWPSNTMRGDDNLWHNAHVSFQEGLEHSMIWLPVPIEDRTPEERRIIETQWELERAWALKVLSAGMTQLTEIQVATKENGEILTTRNGACTFSSTGKKDIAYAMMLAWIAFVHWLKLAETEFGGGDGDDGSCVVVG